MYKEGEIVKLSRPHFVCHGYEFWEWRSMNLPIKRITRKGNPVIGREVFDKVTGLSLNFIGNKRLPVEFRRSKIEPKEKQHDSK